MYIMEAVRGAFTGGGVKRNGRETSVMKGVLSTGDVRRAMAKGMEGEGMDERW